MRVHRPVLFLLLSLLAAAAVAVLASGRGSPGGGPADHGAAAAADALPRAWRATRAVPSGRMEVTTTLTGLRRAPDPPPGGRVTLAVHRVSFDGAARRVEVETYMAALARVLGPGVAGPAGDLSVPARMVRVGDAVYAQGGPTAAAVGRSPAGWVRLDRARLAAAQPRSDTAALVLDPLAPLQVVRGVAERARVVGADRVRGTSVTHLAARVATDPAGDRLARLDIWTDADGVIRRLELRLAGPAGRPGGGAIVTTVELFDVGQPVAITPPPDAGAPP